MSSVSVLGYTKNTIQAKVLHTSENLEMKHMSKSNNIKLKFQDHMDANKGISSGGHEWYQLTVPG